MSEGFVTTIRKLRDRAGLSQQDVADAVGIARATYVKLENGGREPKQSEILVLAKYYEVSPLTIMTGEHLIEEPAPLYKRFCQPDNEPENTTFASRMQPDKLREVLLYVLANLGGQPNFGESTLFRLLYFIDFTYYEKADHSITGLTYVRNHFGPVPAPEFADFAKTMQKNRELEIIETKYFKNTRKKYLPLRTADLTNLDAQELHHIDKALARLEDKSAEELTELSRRESS